MSSREIKQYQNRTWDEKNVILTMKNINTLNFGSFTGNEETYDEDSEGLKGETVYAGHEFEIQSPYYEGRDPNSVWIFNRANHKNFVIKREHSILYYKEIVMMKGTNDRRDLNMYNALFWSIL